MINNTYMYIKPWQLYGNLIAVKKRIGGQL